MAMEMQLKGFQDAGYEYIIIDDCWMNNTRDENGNLQPDWNRFPSGIPALADYIHSLGLKFGIYEDYGNYTCAGYPGILGHLENDANTFASWGADYIKIDGCYMDLDQMEIGYPEFGGYLNATDRPIVYSCSWPAYWTSSGRTPDYAAIAKHCNLWRNYYDIQDNWFDVVKIIDYYGDDTDDFAQYAGPGNWNDPDMLIIGNHALSYDQAKVQMAMWAILAAPLIMSNDLRTIDPLMTSVLTNRNVIAINQDPLGHQGRRVYQENNIDMFLKNIYPEANGRYSHALAVMNRGIGGTPTVVPFTPESIGMTNPFGYDVYEVFGGGYLGFYLPTDAFITQVNPNGVQLYRFETLAASANAKKSHKNLNAKLDQGIYDVGRTGFLV